VARQFSYEAVTKLAEGQSCIVLDTPSVVRRKVAGYATRNNKRFSVSSEETPAHGKFSEVKRLPVTDTELPGAG
jgi:hypothetical protein